MRSDAAAWLLPMAWGLLFRPSMRVESLAVMACLGGLLIASGCGPSVSSSELDVSSGGLGIDPDADDTSGGDDEGGPCSGLLDPTEPLGAATIIIRNLTDEVAYVFAQAPEFGQEPNLFRLYDAGGIEFPQDAVGCVLWCGQDGLQHPTQCGGRETVKIEIDPGGSLEAEWSGRVQHAVELPDECSAESPSGATTCEGRVAASAGAYQIGLEIRQVCNDPASGGEVCDCATCTPDAWINPPTHFLNLDYQGRATVMLDFEG